MKSKIRAWHVMLVAGTAGLLAACTTLPVHLPGSLPAAIQGEVRAVTGGNAQGGTQVDLQKDPPGATPAAQDGAQGSGLRGGAPAGGRGTGGAGGRSGGAGAGGAGNAGSTGGVSGAGGRSGGAGGSGSGAGGRPGGGGARAVAVEVTQVQTGTISQIFTYAGTLQAKDSVKIAPLVSGRIDTVLVNAGDLVKAGTPLAQIEQTQFAAQVRQAQAAYQAAQQKLVRMQVGSRPEEIAAAQAAVRAAQVAVDSLNDPTNDQRTVAAAAVDKARAALQQAQADYDKVAGAPNVGSLPQALALQQATTNYQSAVAAYDLTIKPTDGQLAPLQNNLAQAQLKLALTKQPYIDSDMAQQQAAVDQAKAALDLAQTQLDNSTIRAPFDGVVAEVYVSKGALVSQSTPMFNYLSKSEEVALDVEESRISQIKTGQNAALRVSAFPGRDFPALVTAVAPMADSRTHNFQIKVTPGDEGNLLRAGMYADVQILANEQKNAVVVPATAVTQANNQAIVYVISQDNTAEARPVTLGLADKDRIQVLSGLKPGENVVTAGQSNLTNGARVQIARGS
jgi:HlyD family secretion protein